MAGITIRGRAFIGAVGMTFSADRVNVRASQLECRAVVIEIGWFPGLGGMTFAAVLAQRAVVRVVLLVAAKTGRWRTLISQGGVTLLAGCFFMRSGQFEIG